MSRKRPNIVIFLSDDLGYNDVSSYAPGRHQTPHIDSLADGGIRFTDFHSNGAVCSPTRAALLTGRYQQRCGVEFVLPGVRPDGSPIAERPQLHPGEINLGRAFSRAGYATAFFGKYHTGYLPENSPLKLGFDEFRGICGGMDHHSRYNRWGALNWWSGENKVEEEGYATDLITNHGLHFMEEHRREPFLLYIADWCVHFPWQGPDDPADFAEGVDSDRIPDKFGSRYPHEHRRAYREMVEAQDRNVGRIVRKISELGLTSNTLLIFASDNGGHHEVTDNAPLRGAKGDMFEGGHRVPACACWPETIPGGRVSDETVLTMDIFPSLLSLAGLQPPPGAAFDGIDISGHLLRGESLPGRRLFWRMGPGKAAVREGQWKYVRQEGSESLFDLNADPGENDNRMEGSPDIASNLKAALRRWEEEVDGDR